MIKNLTTAQMLMISIASVVLLLAAFSLLLLQDPSAPLPFALPPATSSPTALAPTSMIDQPTETALPTRQTSYTPFASRLTPSSASELTLIPPTEASTSNPGQTVMPGGATPSKSPTRTAIRTSSATTTTPSITPSPTMTETLSTGEHGVTGQVLRNGTPVANVHLEFEADIGPRQSGTNLTGHYWFTTLAPGTSFTLTFRQSDNPQLTPPAEITSLARIQGVLPTNVNIITLPDLEISIKLNDVLFELQEPVDGATYSASVISSSNKILFAWTSYNSGGTYRIELGPFGSPDPIWTSGVVTSTTYMWDGTLSDGSHIIQGTYWWRVAATKSVGNYTELIFTQPWNILFNP